MPLQLFPLLMNLLCFRVRVGRQPVRTLVGSGQKCRGVVLLPLFRGDQKAVHMAWQIRTMHEELGCKQQTRAAFQCFSSKKWIWTHSKTLGLRLSKDKYGKSRTIHFLETHSAARHWRPRGPMGTQGPEPSRQHDARSEWRASRPFWPPPSRSLS